MNSNKRRLIAPRSLFIVKSAKMIFWSGMSTFSIKPSRISLVPGTPRCCTLSQFDSRLIRTIIKNIWHQTFNSVSEVSPITLLLLLPAKENKLRWRPVAALMAASQGRPTIIPSLLPVKRAPKRPIENCSWRSHSLTCEGWKSQDSLGKFGSDLKTPDSFPVPLASTQNNQTALAGKIITRKIESRY